MKILTIKVSINVRFFFNFTNVYQLNIFVNSCFSGKTFNERASFLRPVRNFMNPIIAFDHILYPYRQMDNANSRVALWQKNVFWSFFQMSVCLSVCLSPKPLSFSELCQFLDHLDDLSILWSTRSVISDVFGSMRSLLHNISLRWDLWSMRYLIYVWDLSFSACYKTCSMLTISKSSSIIVVILSCVRSCFLSSKFLVLLLLWQKLFEINWD